MADKRTTSLFHYSQLASLSLALVFVAMQTAFASPKFTTQYSYFEIGGTSIEEIWYEINLKGPKSSLGFGHAGYTSFDFDNFIKVEPRNGLCQIASIKLHLISNVQIPKWTAARYSDYETRLYWQALSQDVKRHEEQHIEITRQSIIGLEKDLLTLQPHKRCDPLKRKIKNFIKDSERKRNKAQLVFERKEVREQNQRLNNLVEQLRRKARN